MARNPFRRPRDCDGFELRKRSEHNWSSSAHLCYLRIRWGARAACRRLRAANEELRRHVLRLQTGTTIESDYITEREGWMQAELFTARRELRALEWLVKRWHGMRATRQDGRVRLISTDVGGPRTWHATYRDAALSLGMKDTDNA